MQRWMQLLIVVVSLILLTGCGSTAVAGVTQINSPEPSTKAAEVSAPEAYHPLKIDAFADILAKNKREYIIVDVHIPYEGEIEGTDLKIPYNDLGGLMRALPNKDAKIIL